MRRSRELDLALGDRLDPAAIPSAGLRAQYTVEPFLNPVHQLGMPVLGRVASNRVFFLPPPSYPGCGRPRVRGRKIKLNDARTLPRIDARQESELADGRRTEVSRWDDLRMRQWPGQRLALYRVIEYQASGKPRYRRPLWLIFVAASREIKSPSPCEGRATYQARFSVEHSIRFLKGDLGLTCGQFNSTEAEGRVQVSRRDGGDGLLVFAGLARAGTDCRREAPGLVAER